MVIHDKVNYLDWYGPLDWNGLDIIELDYRLNWTIVIHKAITNKQIINKCMLLEK